MQCEGRDSLTVSARRWGRARHEPDAPLKRGRSRIIRRERNSCVRPEMGRTYFAICGRKGSPRADGGHGVG